MGSPFGHRRRSGVARRIRVASPLLALAACTAVPPGRPELELPRIGTVGDLPPEETTLSVEVQRDGRIRIDGRACTFDEYCERLRERAAGLPVSRVGSSYSVSELNLLIEADRDLPYAAVWRLMNGAMIEWRLCVGRWFFGVRSDHDGETGAVALFLPYPTDFRGGPDNNPAWSVELRRGDRGSDPAALFAPLRDAMAELPPWLREFSHVSITPADDVRWGAVLDILDVAMRAGADTIVLSGDVPSEEWSRWRGALRDAAPRDLTAVIAALPEDRRPVSIWFDGRLLGSTAAAGPVPLRREGAYAGQAEFRGYEIPELPGEGEPELEPEPEPERRIPEPDRGR